MRAFVVLCGLTAGMTACTTTALPEASGCVPAPGTLSPEPSVFVPMPADFAGYTSWPSLSIPAATTATTASVHSGPATVYISAPPSDGATTFPVGTRIVKVMAGPDVRIFAMAKRGGDYNATGAKGWEWFELLPTDCVPYFIWRGVGPPSGENYGDTDSSCNACHTGSDAVDHVRTPGLWPKGL